MRSPETIRYSELLKQAKGIAILTKTQESGCPIAEMVAKSGIDHLFNFKVTINPNLGHDFQIIGSGGDSQDLKNFNTLTRAEVDKSSPINAVSISYITSIALYTYLTDNFGRNTALRVALKGIHLPDKMLAFPLLISMFPNLIFRGYQDNPTYQELEQLVTENVIPHPELTE